MTATQTRSAHRRTKPLRRVKGAGSARQIPAGERAYRKLRRRILDNEMPGGATYSEAEIVRMLGLGAAPARDALRRLAAEGLVQMHPRLGVRVLPISIDDMYEIFQIMTALEPMAARQAALGKVSHADLEHLTAVIRQMDTALLNDDLVAWAEADELFHTRLIAVSGSKRLMSVLGEYWDQRHRARMQTLAMRPIPVDSNRDHAAVVDAVRRQDAEAAYALHHDHLARSSAMLINLLRRPAAGQP